MVRLKLMFDNALVLRFHPESQFHYGSIKTDLFIANRLKYVNKVEESIRAKTFYIRLFLYITRYGADVSEALEYAKRGVVIEHALYDSLHTPQLADSTLGKAILYLRQFNFNRIVITLMDIKEFAEAAKALGVFELLKDWAKGRGNKIYAQNPISWLFNFLLINYILMALSRFVPGLQWFMNPLMLAITGTFELIARAFDPDDEDKPSDKFLQFYLFKIGALFYGAGGSALLMSFYNTYLQAIEEGSSISDLVFEGILSPFISAGNINTAAQLYDRIKTLYNNVVSIPLWFD